jgi:hypothetical protein
LFLTMVFDEWIGPAMFYTGLVLSLGASALYMKSGLRQLR